MAESFKIISQSQGNEINPSGTGFMQVWNIGFKVTSGPATGAIGTAQVPEEDHNASRVSTIIAAKVKDLTEVAALGG